LSYIDWNTSEIVSEKLPTPCEYLVIPSNDFGVPNRKRHSSYKFQILTRGKNVQFTPIIDGVSMAPAIYNTVTKREVEYFFQVDTIGIDLGGILQSLESTPFEFYGTITPQTVEKLPDRLEYYRIPNTNFGVLSRKRVRTLPMVIDTGGYDVQYTPIIDDIVSSESAIFNTNGKTTVFYYFVDDNYFGTDFGGELLSLDGKAFEYYEAGEPEIVEKLPVPKKYDQLGPTRFDRIGKIFGFRVRLLMTGQGYNDLNLKYAFYGDADITYPLYSQTQYNGTIQTFMGIDYVYEVQLPKNVNTTMMRLTLGPSDNPFYRFDVEMRVSESGMETDSKWVPLR